ncbi:MAG: DUF1292 domain-containing protein [Clostridia bacterium]|nr:DUF1292 domain-containing protein [Clostridia bacterium]
MENNEPIYIDLELEDGETISCQVIAEYSVDDADYIALVPTNEDKEIAEDAEIYIYGCNYDDDKIELLDLDDEEFEIAGAALDDILEENN